jgi:hypothetical protein
VVSECKEQGIEVIPEDELKSLLGEWKREWLLQKLCIS